MLGDAGFVIQGVETDEFYGFSVTSAGDVNGDGFADLLVGAVRGDDGGFRAGEAYVIWGRANKTIGTLGSDGRWVLDVTALGDAGFTIQGDTARDGFGGSVSAAGDINGDGYGDLIIGARGGNDGGYDAGEAYVIWGGPHLSGY